MAGSYNHCITRKGNLMSNDRMMVSGAMIENLGDAYEAIEEMFGMIWWLAVKRANPHISPQGAVEIYSSEIKAAVEEARQNYKEGLELSKLIHRLRPDNQGENAIEED